MIIPNYTNYKAGLCSDMEYFRFAYAGKDGSVIKRFVTLLGHDHPFYIIKRPIDPLYGHKRCEFKIYDLFHNGFIEKEIKVENEEEKIPSLLQWWDDQLHKGSHFRNYCQFCKDSGKY